MYIQVNLDMTDSMGPGKLVRHMQNPSYTYDEYLICIGLGPSISSAICKNPSYSGPSYPSSPVYGTIFRQTIFQVVEKHWITYHVFDSFLRSSFMQITEDSQRFHFFGQSIYIYIYTYIYIYVYIYIPYSSD